MFKDRPTWTEINRNSNGGLCTNFRATMSFEQHNRYDGCARCTRYEVRVGRKETTGVDGRGRGQRLMSEGEDLVITG